jgi:hypothetical protein
MYSAFISIQTWTSLVLALLAASFSLLTVSLLIRSDLKPSRLHHDQSRVTICIFLLEEERFRCPGFLVLPIAPNTEPTMGFRKNVQGSLKSIRVDEVSAQTCFDFVPQLCFPLLQKSSFAFSRPLLHPAHIQSSVFPMVYFYVKVRDVVDQNKISIFHLLRLACS